MKKIVTTTFLWIIIAFFSIFGQIQLSNSAKITLLTTSPWDGAIYSLYGHTVIRVVDDSTGVDACFNYGYFDSSQPFFLYNFLRGKTDYILGVTTYEQFLVENQLKGLEVIAQDINLSKPQKQQLWNDLYINSFPENREYRYNYFYDNCATRPRDLIERVVEGVIAYPDSEKKQTFRDLVHECVHKHRWMEFGIDLLIGSDADKVISEREKMFLPHYLMRALEDAKVQKKGGISYPLVQKTEIILNSNNEGSNSSELAVLSPIYIAFALFVVSIIVTLFQIRFSANNFAGFYDLVLFSIAGFAGLIVSFLVFFSEHPATSPNWNLVWLHTFHFIVPIFIWFKSTKRLVYYYHFINFAVITLFLLSWYFLPQELHWATIPFSMCLWLRSGVYFFILKGEVSRKRIKQRKRV